MSLVFATGLSSVLDKAQPIVPASAIKATSTTKRSAHLVEGDLHVYIHTRTLKFDQLWV